MKDMKGLKGRSGTRPRGRAALFALPALALLALAAPVSAAKMYPSAGTTSAAFLKIGVGARAVAMAGAYTAIPDGVYSLYWNPAGLAMPGDKALSLTHNDYFEGMAQDYIGFSMPAADSALLRRLHLRNAGLGLGLNYFRVPDDMERRSGLGEAGVITPVEGTFGAYDAALSAGLGYSYSDSLRLGGALKVIRQNIDDEAGNTVAADFGALCDFAWLDRQFTAGLSVSNLGPGIKFDKKRFDLPLTFKAGLSHRVYNKGTLLALDLSKPVDNYPSVALGAEQPVSNKLFLRAGYRYRQHGNELGAFSGFSAGAGFVYDRFSFDYAFSPFGDLGAAHRITLAFRFRTPAPEAARAPTGAEPASERLEGASAAVYAVTRKALKISSRGVEWEISGVSQTGTLSGLEFRALRRGGSPADPEVFEGSLPPALSAGLPGRRVLAAWQLGSGFSGTVSDMKLSFRLTPGQLEAGKPELYYLAPSGWRKAALEALPCEGGACLLRAAAPLSTHYALLSKP